MQCVCKDVFIYIAKNIQALKIDYLKNMYHNNLKELGKIKLRGDSYFF